MGGFSAGELFASLRLDDEQFREALKNDSDLSRVFSLDLAAIRISVNQVAREFNNAGIGLQGLQSFLNSCRAQGLDTAGALNVLADTLGLVQRRINAIHLEELNNLPSTLGAKSGQDPFGGKGSLHDFMQNQVSQQGNQLIPKELADYRTMLELEHQRLEAAKKRFAQEQDYANLVNRIRAEETRAAAEKKAADEVGAQQEQAHIQRVLKSNEDERKARQDYNNLVKKLRKEEADAQAAYDKQQDAVRKQGEDNAKKRQQEIQQQMVANAAGQLRLEKEAANAIEKEKVESLRRQNKAVADAQRAERELYFQHRRQMQLASAATTVGTSIGAVGAVGVGGGIFLGKEAAEFQDAMTKSLANIGTISDQMRDRLAGAAREAAKETGIAAKEIASDYSIMAKGGLDASQSIQAVSQVSKFAVATQSELHESTRQVITIMEAMQIPFNQVHSLLDKLTFANQIARGSVDQLATALEGKAGAALRSAKVDINEALALTIAFSKAGVSAQQSQTFLTQIIEKLRSAATSYGNEIVQVGDKQMKFKDIVYLSDGTMRPFIDTLKLLDTAFQGRSASAIDKFFSDIHVGSARGSQALKILLGVTDSLDVLTDKLKGVSGSMQSAFDTQMQSPLRQLEVLRTKLVDIAITLGTPIVGAAQGMVGALDPLLKKVQDLAAAFAQLPKGAQEAAAEFAVGGSAAVVMGGGLLVLIGHVLRLRADLLSLQQSGALASLTLMASRFGLIAVAITAVVGAIAYLRSEQDKLHQNAQDKLKGIIPDPNQPFNLGDLHAPEHFGFDFGKKFVTTTPKTESNTPNSPLDQFRKILEDMKKEFKDAFQSGDFAIDPEKVLKKQLNMETIRQDLSKFSDDYARVIDQLSGDQQEVVTAALNRINDMLTKGVDLRLVAKAIADAQKDLSRFKGEIELQNRDQTAALARENAATAVSAFRERYLADMRNFTVEQKDVLESLIASMQNGLANGADPKIIQSTLRQVEVLYKTITGDLDNADRMQKKLTESVRKYDEESKKANKTVHEITVPLQDRVPFQLPVDSNIQQLQQVDSIMKALGVKSQEALSLEKYSAEALVAELGTLNTSAYNVHAALVKMWEAEASAAHTSVEQLGGDAKKYYRQYKDEVENSVVAANKQWMAQLKEIGRDVYTTVRDFSRGLFDIIFPKPSDTRNALDPVVSAFRDAFDKLAAYSDPKQALEGIINGIRTAGSQAQANAIAVKYFGDTAGPQLARDIRTGALSLDEIKQAIDKATLSTVDYQKQTDRSAATIGNLWRTLARDIEVSIAQHIIKLGLAELLKWMFSIKDNTLDLGKILVDVWNKIKGAISGASKAASDAADAAAKAAGTAANTGATAAQTAGEGANTAAGAANAGAGAAGGAGGGAGSAAGSGLSGIVSMATGIVTAAFSVLSFFSSMHQETSLNAIEHNTRYTEIIQEEFKRDSWDQHYGMLAKIDMWGHILENAIHGVSGSGGGGNFDYWMSLLVSKFDLFVIPSLATIAGNLQPATAGAGLTINGDVIIREASSTSDLVRQLKNRRIVSGRTN